MFAFEKFFPVCIPLLNQLLQLAATFATGVRLINAAID